jgi:hypothetical protein
VQEQMVSSTTVRKDWKSNNADILLRPQQRLPGCLLPAQAAEGLLQLKSLSYRVLCVDVQFNTCQMTGKVNRLGALLLLLIKLLLCRGARRGYLEA